MDSCYIVSITNKKGVIEYANDNFCTTSGYSRDELVGSTHKLIRHPDNSKELFSNIWRTIMNGGTWQGVIKNRAKDGKEYFVDTTIAPIMDRKGDIYKYISFRHDITEYIKKSEIFEKKAIDKLTGLYNRVKL